MSSTACRRFRQAAHCVQPMATRPRATVSSTVCARAEGGGGARKKKNEKEKKEKERRCFFHSNLEIPVSPQLALLLLLCCPKFANLCLQLLSVVFAKLLTVFSPRPLGHGRPLAPLSVPGRKGGLQDAVVSDLCVVLCFVCCVVPGDL